MIRGIVWSILLLFFILIAWFGWNEYQKVEAYRRWAEDFDQAKYDIYAVLGQKGSEITWGKPTRGTPKDLQSFSLEDVEEIRLLVDRQPQDWETVPERGKPTLEFQLREERIEVPFTEIPLAVKWGKYLEQEREKSGKA